MEQQIKKPFYKKWWFWTVIIFVVLSVIGNNQMNDFEAKKASEPKVEQVSAETTQTPAIKVSAVQISQDYKDNEVAADAKYKGKLVEISGIVDTIGKDITDTPYIALKSYEYAIIDKIQCMFSKSDVEELSQVKKDQQITLQGEVSGKLGNIIVRGCEIVK